MQLIPVISTGWLGSASVISSPLSFFKVRILPNDVPTTIGSPNLNVPFCTKTVTFAPTCLSSVASTTLPIAYLLGLALYSSSSATSKIFSRSLSTPSPVFALIEVHIVSPPHSSGVKPYSASSDNTFSTFAPGLSILLIATNIGTFAALAWSIASLVWGITPSSAATIIITISVILAPLARISVNAACPGVSINVIVSPLCLTWYALIAWVIPPASPDTTSVLRIVSRSVVLPWSTCPIIVTTAGLLTKSSSLSLISNSSNLVSSISCSRSNFLSNSDAIKDALSKSIALLIVARIPIENNFLINNAGFSFKALANSPIVIPSLYITVSFLSTGALLINFSLFLYISFFFLASSFLPLLLTPLLFFLLLPFLGLLLLTISSILEFSFSINSSSYSKSSVSSEAAISLSSIVIASSSK